jgi:hypothetical protein
VAFRVLTLCSLVGGYPLDYMVLQPFVSSLGLIFVNYFRKYTGSHKMESLKKRTPDYTDIAYREAVARLKYLLAESYSTHSSPTRSSQVKQFCLAVNSRDQPFVMLKKSYRANFVYCGCRQD